MSEISVQPLSIYIFTSFLSWQSFSSKKRTRKSSYKKTSSRTKLCRLKLFLIKMFSEKSFRSHKFTLHFLSVCWWLRCRPSRFHLPMNNSARFIIQMTFGIWRRESFYHFVPSPTLRKGFCITYTALLMKTWRVSLTYRVKSAHKVKLTDKQLLQWMVPILLVMGIYLGTWTAAEPPHATDVCNYMKLIHWNSTNSFIFQSPRSQMSKDSFLNSAAIIGGITRWLSARFCFCCGAFESATMFATPSHFTTRPNWFPMQSTTSRWWICWWWQYSKCIQNSKDCYVNTFEMNLYSSL